MTALVEIELERRRQIEREGWTREHDDAHAKGELARAAACYCTGDTMTTRHPRRLGGPISVWPWSLSWWKPADRRRNLIKAGALIVAEIERLDRAERQAREENPEAVRRRVMQSRFGEPYFDN
mgnify:CR=1 FL=1